MQFRADVSPSLAQMTIPNGSPALALAPPNQDSNGKIDPLLE